MGHLTVRDVLADGGYGRGLPVYRPWGADTLRAYRDLFLHNARTELGDVRVWHPTLFRRVVGPGSADPSWEFASTLRVHLPDHTVMSVRPDATVDGLRAALSAPPPTAAVATYQAFRVLDGACAPLLRDQAISPVIQMSVVADVPSAPCVERVIDTFFDQLCLPVRKVDMGTWKQYAAGRVDWMLSTPSMPPTVLAMAYSVGDRIRALSGVPAAAAAFDVGLTAKPIAVLDSLARTRARTVLPSHIAPVSVVVGHVGGPPDHDASAQVDRRVRLRQVSAHSAAWWKPWFWRGAPVIMECRGERARRLVGHGRWERHDPADTMSDLLDASDASIREAAPVGDWPGETGATWRTLCQSCSGKAAYRLDAPVRPHLCRACEMCGADGLLRLTASTEQIY